MPRTQATDRDVGRYDSRDGEGRVAPGAATESNAGDRQGCWKLEQRRSSCRSNCRDAYERPDNPVHFLHCTCDLQGSRKVEQRTTPWMEEVERRQEQRSRSSCRDVQVPRSTRLHGWRSLEPCREQRSRTCKSGLPWRSDVGIRAINLNDFGTCNRSRR